MRIVHVKLPLEPGGVTEASLLSLESCTDLLVDPGSEIYNAVCGAIPTTVGGKGLQRHLEEEMLLELRLAKVFGYPIGNTTKETAGKFLHIAMRFCD